MPAGTEIRQKKELSTESIDWHCGSNARMDGPAGLHAQILSLIQRKRMRQLSPEVVRVVWAVRALGGGEGVEAAWADPPRSLPSVGVKTV